MKKIIIVAGCLLPAAGHAAVEGGPQTFDVTAVVAVDGTVLETRRIGRCDMRQTGVSCDVKAELQNDAKDYYMPLQVRLTPWTDAPDRYDLMLRAEDLQGDTRSGDVFDHVSWHRKGLQPEDLRAGESWDLRERVRKTYAITHGLDDVAGTVTLTFEPVGDQWQSWGKTDPVSDAEPAPASENAEKKPWWKFW